MNQQSRQSMRCTSCGASEFKRSQQPGLLVCAYCGAQQLHNHQQQHNNTPSGQGLMKRILVVTFSVVLLMVVVWFNTSRHMDRPVKVDQPLVSVNEVSRPLTVLPAEAEQDHVIEATGSTEEATRGQSVNDALEVVHQVAGTTTNGGRYWIFELRNTAGTEVFKPHVMVSLFDAEGKRVAEQGGWSYQHRLNPGEQTHVMVFMSEPPVAGVTEQITTLASGDGRFVTEQLALKIADFKVSKKYSQYQIIGDVTNQHQVMVKYPRVVVVALNEAGQVIGQGQSFSTLKALQAGEGSGFKVGVGTFLTAEPASWRVYALAQKS